MAPGRFAGWRAWIARLCVLLLALHLASGARAGLPTALAQVPVCTADGLRMAPAPDGVPSTDGAGAHCALCVLSAGGALDVPPAAAVAPLADDGLRVARAPARDAPKPAFPPGSPGARAPPDRA